MHSDNCCLEALLVASKHASKMWMYPYFSADWKTFEVTFVGDYAAWMNY
jgi:hypothetical protein